MKNQPSKKTQPEGSKPLSTDVLPEPAEADTELTLDANAEIYKAICVTETKVLNDDWVTHAVAQATKDQHTSDYPGHSTDFKILNK